MRFKTVSVAIVCAALACAEDTSRAPTAPAVGVQGQQSLTGANVAGVNECAAPRAGWVFCDDFEMDRLSKYFEYDSASGRFVRAASTGLGGSIGMRATYDRGPSSAGSLHLGFGRVPSNSFRPVDAGTAKYREVYWRFYARRETGWKGGGAGDLSEATIFAKSNRSQAMIANVWSADDPGYLLLDPASGTNTNGTVIAVGEDDYGHWRWLGPVRSVAAEEDQAHVGQWACYEFHVKLNTAGQSNGTFEMTVNGQLSGRKTGLNWVGSYNVYGINAVYLEQYTYNAAAAGNVRTLDNFVVSTQPIGCDSPAPPSPTPVASVTITPATLSGNVGQTVQLRAAVKDANGNTLTDRVVTWVSANPSVASVSSTGLAALQGAGSTVISATTEGITGQASVSVTAVPVPVAMVTVTPKTASGIVGQTAQLAATTTDANGNILTGRAISWATSSASVATVNASGVVTMQGVGSATVTATSEGKTGSASVTVNSPAPAPVATVTVTPAAWSGNVGQTVQLTATARDANGNTLAGRVITWATSSASVATVNASGLVTMNAAGTVTVTATSEGKTGSASLTVTSPAGMGPNECASPNAGWVFCDDFETDRLAKYFEYNNSGGKFARTTGTGFGGSVGMRTTYTTGQAAAGSLALAVGRTPSSYFRAADAGTANYRELYWRVYVRREAGWVGDGPQKLTRATIFAKSDWSQAMIAHGWTYDSDDRFLMIDPARGTDAGGNVITVGYNDFNHLQWLGGARSTEPEEDQAHVGQWACLEYHVKLNDAGQSNGVFEFRVNGQISAQRTGLNWVGAYGAYGINAVFLENFQNDGAPAANKRTFDNFVVSTQPIGCHAGGGTP